MLTEATLRAKCLRHIQLGKRELKKAGPSSNIADSGMLPVVTFIWNSGLENIARIGFKNFEQKRAWGAAISATAALTHPRALIVRQPMTMLNAQKANPAMGFADPLSVTYEEWESKMWKWVESLTGGSHMLGKLPREYTIDTLGIYSMGQGLPTVFIQIPYVWTNGTIHFGEAEEKQNVEVFVIPKWWKETVN
jgi:hypothetical protein